MQVPVLEASVFTAALRACDSPAEIIEVHRKMLQRNLPLDAESVALVAAARRFMDAEGDVRGVIKRARHVQRENHKAEDLRCALRKRQRERAQAPALAYTGAPPEYDEEFVDQIYVHTDTGVPSVEPLPQPVPEYDDEAEFVDQAYVHTMVREGESIVDQGLHARHTLPQERMTEMGAIVEGAEFGDVCSQEEEHMEQAVSAVEEQEDMLRTVSAGAPAFFDGTVDEGVVGDGASGADDIHSGSYSETSFVDDIQSARNIDGPETVNGMRYVPHSDGIEAEDDMQSARGNHAPKTVAVSDTSIVDDVQSLRLSEGAETEDDMHSAPRSDGPEAVDDASTDGPRIDIASDAGEVTSWEQGRTKMLSDEDVVGQHHVTEEDDDVLVNDEQEMPREIEAATGKDDLSETADEQVEEDGTRRPEEYSEKDMLRFGDSHDVESDIILDVSLDPGPQHEEPNVRWQDEGISGEYEGREVNDARVVVDTEQESKGEEGDEMLDMVLSSAGKKADEMISEERLSLEQREEEEAETGADDVAPERQSDESAWGERADSNSRKANRSPSAAHSVAPSVTSSIVYDMVDTFDLDQGGVRNGMKVRY